MVSNTNYAKMTSLVCTIPLASQFVLKKVITHTRQLWNIDVNRGGLTAFPGQLPAPGLLLNHSLLKQWFVLLWSDISTLWNSHWKTTNVRHPQPELLACSPKHPSLILFSFPLPLSSHPWESCTNKTTPVLDPPHSRVSRLCKPISLPAIASGSCWHDREGEGKQGGVHHCRGPHSFELLYGKRPINICLLWGA